MQFERKLSTKPYVNTVTMVLRDPIDTIPQEEFFVTEDNWAWDMSELAQAITAHSGVMRNPETGEMFSPQDIRNILAHPQGKHLAALRIAQKQMFQGVRPETITRMEALADTMEGERGTQWDETWEAIRGFQAYIATCTLSVAVNVTLGVLTACSTRGRTKDHQSLQVPRCI